MKEKITVIGIGADGRDGVGKQAQAALIAADRIFGAAELLALFPELPQPKTAWDKAIRQTLVALKDRRDGEKIVILASGDPNFHGVGGLLLQLFPAEEIEILPQATTLQAAFSRSGISWDDAVFLSAHTRLPTSLLGWLRRTRKIGLLCGKETAENTPEAIARRLLAAGMNDLDLYVYGNLGFPDETHFHGSLDDCAARSFPTRSVMLLLHGADWEPVPESVCRSDDAYAHRNGLITKQDIRTLCFARMGLKPDDTVWDIGAGSGAVSVEAAERAWRGQVTAFEKDAENLACIATNQARYTAANLTVIPGEAPESFAGLALPDVAFIGGTGGRTTEILDFLSGRHLKPLKFVMTFVLLENLSETLRWCRDHGFSPSVIQAAINDGVPTSGGMHLSPKNPVFILDGTLS